MLVVGGGKGVRAQKHKNGISNYLLKAVEVCT